MGIGWLLLSGNEVHAPDVRQIQSYIPRSLFGDTAFLSSATIIEVEHIVDCKVYFTPVNTLY